MTQTIHVYVFDGLADWEVGHTIGHLNQPDYQKRPDAYRVRTVGPTQAPITSLGGMRILPDMTLDALQESDSALLVLPGGASWDAEPTREVRAILEKARSFEAAGVPIAAICGATAGLARMGLLNARAHTSNARMYLEAVPGYAGAPHYREERAVCDRGVVTAGGTNSVAFAREVFKLLDVYEPHVLEAWYGLFSTGDARYFAALARQA